MSKITAIGLCVNEFACETSAVNPGTNAATNSSNGKAQPQGLVSEAGDGAHGVLDTAQEAELAIAAAALLAIVVEDDNLPTSNAG